MQSPSITCVESRHADQYNEGQEDLRLHLEDISFQLHPLHLMLLRTQSFLLKSNIRWSSKFEFILKSWNIFFRCVLLTLWQKLHTISRPTLISKCMRSTLNLVEWWTLREIAAAPRGNKIWSYFIPCHVGLSHKWAGTGWTILWQSMAYLIYKWAFN